MTTTYRMRGTIPFQGSYRCESEDFNVLGFIREQRNRIVKVHEISEKYEVPTGHICIMQVAKENPWSFFPLEIMEKKRI
jgi:hypothetical protein